MFGKHFFPNESPCMQQVFKLATKCVAHLNVQNNALVASGSATIVTKTRMWLQAMVPKAVKDMLKPWQLEGLHHLFDTIILDHETEIRKQHLRDERSAAAGGQAPQGDDDSDNDDENPVPGGCILAHTMGAGKTFQVLLFAAFLFCACMRTHKHLKERRMCCAFMH
jgi:SNF2 family DNA or RNA helicase